MTLAQRLLKRLGLATSAPNTAPNPAPSPSADAVINVAVPERFRASAAPVFVCIVSQEPLANLIPILQNDVKNGSALLLVSPAMKTSIRAAHLQRFLEARGIECHLIDLDDSDLTTLSASANGARDWLLANAQHSHWWVNLTGGTKLMSREIEHALEPYANATLLYVDSGRSRIHLLRSNTSDRYHNLIGVNDYLLAQGFKANGRALSDQPWYRQQSRQFQPLIDAMLSLCAGRYSGGDLAAASNQLAALNVAAQQVIKDRDLKQPLQQETAIQGPVECRSDYWRERFQPQFPRRIAEQAPGAPPKTRGGVLFSLGEAQSPLLEALVAAGALVAGAADEGRYAFADIAPTLLIGGAWLEWYAMAQARSLGFGDEHVKHGQEVLPTTVRQTRYNKNELDLVLVHEARMLIVECKTVRMQGQSDKVSDAIYKLEYLRDNVGSARAQAVLVSANPLQDDELGRLRALGTDVHYCAGADLPRFAEFLELWKANRLAQWKPQAPPKPRGKPPESKRHRAPQPRRS
jgi:hypothetical protein